ncbi:CopG family ribbon-helix-helix protein [Thioalkalivibrio sp. ALE19]|uniref:CopG family ribbon-helix-helix protein n=1 Tax=Thioalkalivibrio sp. ALE19 TaxID=1266909 RepID=UPI0004008149|nr:hypothetical protein [Thioalkalivibrio sp. ALE19]
MKQNITLSLDKQVLTELKVIAARRSTSVSRLLTEELEHIVERSDRYERSRREALAALDRGYHFGGGRPDRDALHER